MLSTCKEAVHKIKPWQKEVHKNSFKLITMAHEGGNWAKPREDSTFDIEDQKSISTISKEIEEYSNEFVVSSNTRKGKNKVHPKIKRVDGVEERLGTSAIFNQSIEGGKNKRILGKYTDPTDHRTQPYMYMFSRGAHLNFSLYMMN